VGVADAHPYAGMTINERLVAAGLVGSFDAAVSLRDRAAMIRILTEVDVGDPAASVDAVLQRPAYYGC
jgi:hypothetical protein